MRRHGKTYDEATSPRKALSLAIKGGLTPCALGKCDIGTGVDIVMGMVSFFY